MLLSLLTLTAGIFGCDMSEDDALLNPPLPDSVQVRIVNLSNGNIDFNIDEISAVKELVPGTSTSFAPFFNRELFPITIAGSGIVDTIPDSRFPTSASAFHHYTYFVTGNADARRLITLSSSSTERADLENQDLGRVYFINAVPDRSFLLRQGCRSGAQIFPPVAGPGFGSSQDLPQGDHSFYLFEGDSTAESASARLTINPGEVVALIVGQENGMVKFYTLPLYTPNPAGGQLQETTPETRNSANLRILNGLRDEPISAGLMGQGTPIASDLQPLSLSASTPVEICSEAGGDTLVIVTRSGDTTRAPILVEVGGEATIIVFDNDIGGIRAATLNRPSGSPSAGTFRVRGVNLTNVETVSVTARAGAPEGITPGFRLFSSPGIGVVTPYRELPAGLYPVALEQTSNGTFYQGGLYRFEQGDYTLLTLEENDKPSLYILKESAGTPSLEPLQSIGRQVNFFSMVPNGTVSFEATTSLGTIRITDVAYSYVFPGILPAEQVTINGTGTSATTLDLSTSGYTVGLTGESNRQLVAFPRPTEPVPAGKAAIRFLNGVPGEGRLEIRSDSSKGPVETTIDFGTPSPTVIKEVRRQTFSVTVAGTTEEVARISGVELSEGRNYLLVIGPKGPTSGSAYRYGTLWMQE